MISVVQGLGNGSLVRRTRPKTLSQEALLNKVARDLTQAIWKLLNKEDWTNLATILQLTNLLSREDSFIPFYMVRAGVTQALLKVVTSCAEPYKADVMEQVTYLLCECIRVDEMCADAVMESQFIRLLFDILKRPDSTRHTKRHIALAVHFLSNAKLVYKDVLQGAGVLDALLVLLSKTATLADMWLTQEVLWILISLADDDVVYKEHVREVGMLKVLVQLMGIVQISSRAADLRPLSAQVVRCLHILAHDDDVIKEDLRRLGFLDVLVRQLQHDLHVTGASMSSGGVEAGSISTVPSFSAAPMAPSRTMSSTSTSTALPRGGDSQEIQGGDEPFPPDTSGWSATPETAPRLVLALQYFHQLGLLGLPDLPVHFLCYMLLLPRLSYHIVGKRLSLLTEVSGALKTVMCDSPSNQDAACMLGVIPCLVKLLYARNLNIAGQSADAISFMVGHREELITNGAVEGLTELLRECAQNLSRMALARQQSNNAVQFPGAAPGRRQSLEHDVPLIPAKKGWHQPLTGRQRISSQGGAGCFLSSHDNREFCGFCALSAVIRALLRVVTPEKEVQERFVHASGVPVLIGLLKPEVGQHHSRVAQSLVSLLNVVLYGGNTLAQDELRFCGGLQILAMALQAMVQPGVGDILQLRVALCTALERAALNNSANKLALREQGCFTPLLTLLKALATPEGPRDVDDVEQLEVAVVDTLCVCMESSHGNQGYLHALGITHVMMNLVKYPHASLALTLSAVRALGLLCEANAAARAWVTENGVVPSLLQMLGQGRDSQTEITVLRSLCYLLHDNHLGRQQALSEGLVAILLNLLKTAPSLDVLMCAARTVNVLSLGDPDFQTEVCKDGGMEVFVEMLEAGVLKKGGQACEAALIGLMGLMHHNPANKNMARPLRVMACLGQLLTGKVDPQVTCLAAATVAELCDSNHSNQDTAAADGVVEDLMVLLMAMVNDLTLQRCVASRDVLTEIIRAAGNAAEFHDNNKIIVREAGGLGAMMKLLLLTAEVPDVSHLQQMGLVRLVSTLALAITKLSQDCDENKKYFLGESDFLPALFRFMGLEEPTVSLECARALEYTAIRSTGAMEGDEEQSDFEGDTILSLVKLLPRSNTGAAVREASEVLRLVATSSALDEPSPPEVKPGKTFLGIRLPGQGSKKKTPQGGHHVPPGPVSHSPATGPFSPQNLTANTQSSTAHVPAPVTGSAGPPTPGNVSPALVLDHMHGLAVHKGLSGRDDPGDWWQSLVARSAPVFQHVSAIIAEGPWRPFKIQVAWMLFLLGAKSAANREMISKLERTTITPLAQQLENAERYQELIKDDPWEQPRGNSAEVTWDPPSQAPERGQDHPGAAAEEEMGATSMARGAGSDDPAVDVAQGTQTEESDEFALLQQSADFMTRLPARTEPEAVLQEEAKEGEWQTGEQQEQPGPLPQASVAPRTTTVGSMLSIDLSTGNALATACEEEGKGDGEGTHVPVSGVLDKVVQVEVVGPRHKVESQEEEGEGGSGKKAAGEVEVCTAERAMAGNEFGIKAATPGVQENAAIDQASKVTDESERCDAAGPRNVSLPQATPDEEDVANVTIGRSGPIVELLMGQDQQAVTSPNSQSYPEGATGSINGQIDEEAPFQAEGHINGEIPSASGGGTVQGDLGVPSATGATGFSLEEGEVMQGVHAGAVEGRAGSTHRGDGLQGVERSEEEVMEAAGSRQEVGPLAWVLEEDKQGHPSSDTLAPVPTPTNKIATTATSSMDGAADGVAGGPPYPGSDNIHVSPPSSGALVPPGEALDTAQGGEGESVIPDQKGSGAGLLHPLG